MVFPLIFKPKHNYLLKRFGKENDGGYLVNSDSILSSNFLLSIGIFDDWSFEKSFMQHNKNAKIFCYDDLISFNFIFTRSLKKIAIDLINFKFSNIFNNLQRISDYIFISNKIKFLKKKIIRGDVPEIIKNFDKVFLKIDIEGSEYEILNDILEIQNRLTALIIEFHYVDRNRDKIENFINKLELELTHIHPNNYGALDQNGDPILLELSFERQTELLGGEIKFPNILDQKNNPKNEDIKIRFNEK